MLKQFCKKSISKELKDEWSVATMNHEGVLPVKQKEIMALQHKMQVIKKETVKQPPLLMYQ